MMPTTLPPRTIPAPTLTLGQTVRFFWLLGRSRWLHHRLEAAHRHLDRAKTDAAGDALLRAAERWLACHEEIGVLLNLPVPPHVEEVRAVLRVLPHP
jgi:hypothetical protein